MKSNNLVYLSYDGILEPLGYSQVYKYLEGLSAETNITLISFEKKHLLSNKESLIELQKECSDNNITWVIFKYHKTPRILATLFDISKLTLYLFYLNFRSKIHIIHLRGYLLGMPVLILKPFINFSFIFDTRGFWPDEVADRRGLSRDSFTYKLFKRIEQLLLKYSFKIITLTRQAQIFFVNEFKTSASKISVIPTCSDQIFFDNFTDDDSNPKEFKISYLGTGDGAYNFDAVCFVFKKLHSFFKNAKFYIYSSTNEVELKKILDRHSIKEICYEIRFLPRKELISELKKTDLALFNLHKNFSIQASMPTKIGELLALGVPIMCNDFNQDILEINEYNNCINICNFDQFECRDLEKFLSSNSLRQRCNQTAKQFFHISNAINEYSRIYNQAP